MKTAWVTASTIQPLLQKAHRDAFILALEKNIITKDTATHLLSKAYSSMLSVASKLKQEALDEELQKKIT